MEDDFVGIDAVDGAFSDGEELKGLECEGADAIAERGGFEHRADDAMRAVGVRAVGRSAQVPFGWVVRCARSRARGDRGRGDRGHGDRGRGDRGRGDRGVGFVAVELVGVVLCGGAGAARFFNFFEGVWMRPRANRRRRDRSRRPSSARGRGSSRCGRGGSCVRRVRIIRNPCADADPLSAWKPPTNTSTLRARSPAGLASPTFHLDIGDPHRADRRDHDVDRHAEIDERRQDHVSRSTADEIQIKHAPRLTHRVHPPRVAR